jgi:hypothetical protein
MDAIIKKLPSASLRADVYAAPQSGAPRPSREDAEKAVRTLIAFAGDNPGREGLVETPRRVVSAFEELYVGYREFPAQVLDRTFTEIGTYDDLVLVRDIPFNSHCEHHMMPFYGKAHVAYLPVDRDRRNSQTARRGRDDRGRAHVHVAARRREGGHDNRHVAICRRVPRGSGRAGAFHHACPWRQTLMTGPLETLRVFS